MMGYLCGKKRRSNHKFGRVFLEQQLAVRQQNSLCQHPLFQDRHLQMLDLTGNQIAHQLFWLGQLRPHKLGAEGIIHSTSQRIGLAGCAMKCPERRLGLPGEQIH